MITKRCWLHCDSFTIQSWRLPHYNPEKSKYLFFFTKSKLFLHRLYAGSSNTVAPNNSQGFQVIQFMIIASPSFIFTTIFKDQFGSHHLTLMSAYCQNQHIFRINLVPTTQLWCYNQLIVIFTTIFRINLVLTIQLWWVGLGIQAHSLTTRPWDSPGANVDFALNVLFIVMTSTICFT